MNAAARAIAAVKQNPYAVAMAVSLAAFMEVLDTTITNVSLTHIAGTLGSSQDESTWVLTSYLVANGIVLPISGWLSNVIGRKRFFLICITGFTVASLLCGMANSLGMLIVFRLIQGLCGGGLQPTQQAIIMDSFPPEKRGAAMGITGITMIVAPILGPTLGGFITDNYSWRWIFFMNVPVGILAFFLVSRMVQDPPHAKAQGLKTIDYTGLSLVALGLGALQIVLDKGQQEDWFHSQFIVITTIVAVLSLIAAVIWLLKQDDPVIDLRLLLKPSFGLSCLMIFFTGAVLYGSSALLPILVQSQFGYDATLAGLVLSPGGFAVIFLMPLVGRLVGIFPARYLVAIGMAMGAFGMWMTMHITPQSTYEEFVMMRVFQVLGLPLLFVPVSTLAFMNMPKEKSNKASALFSLSRNLGGSIGISLLANYVFRHQQIHQAHLAENLSPTHKPYTNMLADYAHTIFSAGQTMATATAQATGRIYRELGHQAAILAYDDAFRLMSLIMIALVVVAFIMPHNDPRKRAAPNPAAH
jgi:DHA2 family multidrug resistance protein